MANDYLDILRKTLQGQQQETEIPFAPEQAPMPAREPAATGDQLIPDPNVSSPEDQFADVMDYDNSPNPMQEEVKEAKNDAELVNINEEMKSPYMKTPAELQKEQAEDVKDRTVQGQLQEEVTAKKGQVDPMLEQYKDVIKQYREKMAQPKKEYGAMDALPDILTGLYNIGSRAKGGVLPEMQMPNTIQRKKAADKLAQQEDLSGLQNLQKMYANYMGAKKKDGLSLRDQLYFTQARERLDLQKERLERQSKREGRLGKQFDYRREQKFEDDARNALKDLRQTDTWKTGEKALAEIDTIEVLLEDAYKEGGQSLAMLGPKIAKGIAGEVGVLTEQDVKRYIKNPKMVESIMDTMKKVTQGKLTEASYDNLRRLMDISRQTSKDKIDKALDREATLLARREKVPYEEARYYIDNEFEKNMLEQKSKYVDSMLGEKGKKQASPSKVEVTLPNGKRGRIDSDKVDAFLEKYPNAQVME